MFRQGIRAGADPGKAAAPVPLTHDQLEKVVGGISLTNPQEKNNGGAKTDQPKLHTNSTGYCSCCMQYRSFYKNQSGKLVCSVCLQ